MQQYILRRLLLAVPVLFGLSLVFGVINAFDNPVRRSLVTELVPDADVANAVGLNSALMTGSRVIGPALAGVLIAGPGAGVAFALAAPGACVLAVVEHHARAEAALAGDADVDEGDDGRVAGPLDRHRDR